jgi:hypothetical protein
MQKTNIYQFNLIIRTEQKQEFTIGFKLINALNYDEALKTLNKMDLPFHHFATVTIINK